MGSVILPVSEQTDGPCKENAASRTISVLRYQLPATMAKSKCTTNNYYDGLLEKCKPCYLRCSNSPPISCTEFCTKSPDSPVPANNNVWVILVVFLFLNVFITMILLVQILRKKKCAQASKQKGADQNQVEDSGIEGVSDTVKKATITHDVVKTCKPVVKEVSSDGRYNSSLPLPSTEEGTTVLVTTKTTQAYCTEGNTFGLREAVFVA